jgi:hypothetical protein
MYKIKTFGNEFAILEIESNMIIFKSMNEVLVKKLCKSLNGGSGFFGHTPRFFSLLYTQVA